jgi:SAM-dependent methyltransferase
MTTSGSDAWRIRERIRHFIKRRDSAGRYGPAPPSVESEATAALTVAVESQDVYNTRLESSSRATGPFVHFVRGVLRRLLAPVLLRQTTYNAALVRAVAGLSDQVSPVLAEVTEVRAEVERGERDVKRELALVREELQDLRAALAEVVAVTPAPSASVDQLSAPVSRVGAELSRPERRIETPLVEADRPERPSPDGAEIQRVAEEKRVLNTVYAAFEDQFRGTREDIKQRVRVYLPLIWKARLGAETTPIVDLGSGRGEWLELLGAEGFVARGVDVNSVFVTEGRRRGLDVVETDAVSYLRTLPDGSVGVVTAIHLLEHLSFEVVIALLSEIVRVLTGGGLAIFETPNPENLQVGAYYFYLDPTHRNPIPRATLAFLVGARGLQVVEMLRLHPLPDTARLEGERSDVRGRFDEHSGDELDYAIVARKPLAGPEESAASG